MRKLIFLLNLILLFLFIKCKTADEYFAEATQNVKSENYTTAIQIFNKAIEINPELAEAYNNRGAAKSGIRNYIEAIKDYNKAIELNPEFVEAYNNRGIAKAYLKDFRGAVQDFNKSLELNPYVAETYFNRGIVNRKLQNFEEAVHDFNKAIQLNPDFAEAYNNRGLAKCRLKDLRSIIELNDNNMKLFGFNNIKNNDDRKERNNKYIEDAINDFNKAININPNYSNAYLNRGIARLFLQDNDSACLDFSKAGEFGNHNAYRLINNYCN